MSMVRKLTKKTRAALNRELDRIRAERPLFGRPIDGLGGGPGSLCWRIREAHDGLSRHVDGRTLLEESVRLPMCGVPEVLIPSSRYPHVLLLLAERALERDDVHHSTKRAIRRILFDILDDMGTSAITMLAGLAHDA